MNLIGYLSNGTKKEFKVHEKGYVDCSHKQLTKIIIPENVKYINCSFNQLTEINIPNSVIQIDCFNNKLKHIELNENIKNAFLIHNQLESIKINNINNIEKLYTSFNNFTNNKTTYNNIYTKPISNIISRLEKKYYFYKYGETPLCNKTIFYQNNLFYTNNHNRLNKKEFIQLCEKYKQYHIIEYFNL